jgi:zinc protease
LYPYLNSDAHGFRGNCPEQSIETFLQLLYQFLTRATVDSLQLKKYKSSISGYQTTYEDQFADTIWRLSTHLLMDEEMKMNNNALDFSQKKVLDSFNSIFRDFSNYTFVITGKFDTEYVRELCSKYLGALPKKSAPVRRAGDCVVVSFKAPIERTMYLHPQDKAIVQMRLPGHFVPNALNQIQLEIVANILQERLSQKLREKERGTYSIVVVAQADEIVRNEFAFTIFFDCQPKRVKHLVNSVIQEVDSLSKYGPTRMEFENAKRIQIARQNENLLNAVYWNAYLTSMVKKDKTAITPEAIASLTRSMSFLEIKDWIHQCLPTHEIMRFIMMPKSMGNYEY